MLDEADDIDEPLAGTPRREELGLDDGSRPATVETFALVRIDGTPASHVRTGEPVRLEMTVRFRETVEDVIVGVIVENGAGLMVYWDTIPFDASRRFDAGDSVRVEVPLTMALAGGSYRAELGMVTTRNRMVARVPSMISFFVDGRQGVHGVSDLGADFKISTVGD